MYRTVLDYSKGNGPVRLVLIAGVTSDVSATHLKIERPYIGHQAS